MKYQDTVAVVVVFVVAVIGLLQHLELVLQLIC